MVAHAESYYGRLSVAPTDAAGPLGQQTRVRRGTRSRTPTLLMSDLRPSRREFDDLAATLSARYLQALLDADRTTAEAVLRDAIEAGLGAAAAFARIVQPAMVAVGSAWERGELEIAQEHLATGITKRTLAAVYPLLIEDAPSGGPRVVVAGPGGQLHSIGLRMVSDVLDAAGFETLYLGPDTPAEDVASAVVRYAPQLVALGVTMPLDVPELERAVVAIAEADPTVSVMIGGSGVPERLRAHPTYAGDAEAVVATARRLIAEAPVLPPVEAPPTPVPSMRRTDRIEREIAATTAQLADVARAQARRARAYRTMALTDALTGLPNRRAWDERCAAVTEGSGETMLVLDLDGFKAVNDRLGHSVGDTVLARAADAVRSALRADDFAARLGGDEFGVLLRGGAEDAAAVADRVRAAIAAALRDVGVTTSVGTARHAGDRRAAMLAADAALYEAKTSGGDRVRRAP